MSDVLARIGHALAVQDAVPTSDSDWLPGDPLYDRPRGGAFGEQTVRQMFDVFHDFAMIYARCEPCQVSWAGPDPCWMCGAEQRRSGRIAEMVRVDFRVDVSAAVQQLERARAAMRSFDEVMRTTTEAFAAATNERTQELLDQLRPEPDPALMERIAFGRARFSVLPAVADPAAPTLDELAAGVPVPLFLPDPRVIAARSYAEAVQELVARADLAEERAPVVADQDPDDTVTRRDIRGHAYTLSRARYPRPSDLDNQENR